MSPASGVCKKSNPGFPVAALPDRNSRLTNSNTRFNIQPLGVRLNGLEASMSPQLKPILAPSVETRQKLLDAAVRLFAEHGFRSVSVRDLCMEAGANIAAINYHFGGKQGLYVAIFESTLDADEARFQESLENMHTLIDRAAGSPAALASVASLFVKGLLSHLVGDDRTRWFGILVTRELAFPSAAFDLIYRRRAEPSQNLLAKLIAAASGVGAESASARLQAHALSGMVVHVCISRAILCRRMDWEEYSPERIAHVGETLTQLICSALALAFSGVTAPSGEKNDA